MKAIFYFLLILVVFSKNANAQGFQKIDMEHEVRVFKMKIDSIYYESKPSIYSIDIVKKDDSGANYDVTIRPSFNAIDYCDLQNNDAYFVIDSAIVLFPAYKSYSRLTFPRHLRSNIHVIASHYKFESYIITKHKFTYWIKINSNGIERGISAKHCNYLNAYPANFLYQSIVEFVR